MPLIYLILFLSVGLSCSSIALRRGWIPKEFLYLSSISFSLVFSYIIFFAYNYRYRLGHYFTLLFFFMGTVALVYLIASNWKSKKNFDTVKTFFIVPLFIILATLTLYSYIYYGCAKGSGQIAPYGEVQNSAFCHVSNLPFDNALPFIYGEKVLANHSKDLIIDWSIADRPPLQIGAVLPLLDFSQDAQPYTKYAYYSIFSTFLQLSWIGVAWGALYILVKKRWKIYTLILGFGCTGFFYLNSVFVWPKLLAASLVVYGLFLILDASKKHKTRFTYRYLPAASIGITLGLLAHGGVLFTVLAVCMLIGYDLIRNRKLSRRISLRAVLAALLICTALLVPWQIAKSELVSSDRLVKWHFAGIEAPTDKRGTLKTIEDQYKTLTIDEWLRSKSENISSIYKIGDYRCGPLYITSLLSKCNMETWRGLTFYRTLFAFELFIVGAFIFLWRLLQNRVEKIDKTLALITLSSLFVWIIAMYSPGSTLLHQGSYATMLIAFLIFGKQIALANSLILPGLVILQLMLYYFAWLHPFSIL